MQRFSRCLIPVRVGRLTLGAQRGRSMGHSWCGTALRPVGTTFIGGQSPDVIAVQEPAGIRDRCVDPVAGTNREEAPSTASRAAVSTWDLATTNMCCTDQCAGRGRDGFGAVSPRPLVVRDETGTWPIARRFRSTTANAIPPASAGGTATPFQMFAQCTDYSETDARNQWPMRA